jgi:hypothetical protein
MKARSVVAHRESSRSIRRIGAASRALLDREYIPLFVAALLLVALGVLVNDRTATASELRESNSTLARKRASATAETFRDAYGFRAPAALRANVAEARQLALTAELNNATGSTATGLRAMTLDDSSALRTDAPIAAPLREAGLDVGRYLGSSTAGYRDVLKPDIAGRERRARSYDDRALWLRLVAGIVTLGVFLAAIAKLLDRASRRRCVAVAWLAIAAAVPLTVVVM